MSYMCKSYVTRMNESCHTYGWVMAHIWVSHGTRAIWSCHPYGSRVQHKNESCRPFSHAYQCITDTYQCITDTQKKIESCHPYEWIATHSMDELCHAYEWVMAHIWVSHGTHMSESCHTYEWVMAHIWVSHGTHSTNILQHLFHDSYHTFSVTTHSYTFIVTHMNKS